MMKTIELFVTKNEKAVTNIPKSLQKAKLRSLKTRYMTLSSYDENNEYTGFNIELRWINCEKGIAQFEKGKEGYSTTIFNMDIDDDPVVVFENEPGFEFHIFEKDTKYEINPEIKQGRLYKFQEPFTNEWFLAVVQSVSPSFITLNKFDISRQQIYKNPSIYELHQRKNIDGLDTSEPATVEKYKNYVVTELYDLTTGFDDADNDVEEDDKNESKNQEKD